MATVNFYLVRRDKSDVKKVQVKYLDKTSKGKKTSFLHSLNLTVHPDKWNPRIDDETKQEKWLVGDSNHVQILNEQLLRLKEKFFQIRDMLTLTDELGNKIRPSVEQMEAAYRNRLDENGWLQFERNQGLNGSGTIANFPNPNMVTIIDLISDYISKGGREGDIEDGTKNNLEYAKKHLEGFHDVTKRDFKLSRLDLDFFNDLKNYLVRPKDEDGAGQINSTAKKYLSRIRDVMSYYKLQYPNMHGGFFMGKYPPVDKQVIFALYDELAILKNINFRNVLLDEYLNRFLTAADNGESYWTTKELSKIMKISEATLRKGTFRFDMPGTLKKIANYETYVFDKESIIKWVKDNEWCQEKNRLEEMADSFNRVRDWYCFACEAPLRHSDLKNLVPKVHIREGRDNTGKAIKVVRLHPQKTIRHRILQQFPLSEYCLSIIEKYRHEVPETRLLPVTQSNSALNDVLHRMFKQSGLFNDELVIYEGQGKKLIETCEPRWSVLSFHTSRHTFGTNMAAQNVNLLNIMRALGHAKLSTTQIYLQIVEDDFYSVILNNFINRPEPFILKIDSLVQRKDGFRKRMENL